MGWDEEWEAGSCLRPKLRFGAALVVLREQ